MYGSSLIYIVKSGLSEVDCFRANKIGPVKGRDGAVSGRAAVDNLVLMRK